MEQPHTSPSPSPSELSELLNFLTPREREEVDKLLLTPATWELLPGPQVEAADTLAFETLFGGEPGGGKTEVIAWLAKNRHHHSLVLRRSFPELERTLIPRMLEKYPEPKYYNRADHVWRLPDGQRIELGYLDTDRDVYRYQGAEIDGFFPDELTQFPRDWYLYIFSRIRSTRAKQRKRVVATSNPGGEYEAWVKERWGPWLDNRHANPAQSGEIRWFRRVNSKADYAEEEVPVDHPSVTSGDAWSRTFIRAGVKDNPFIGRDYLLMLDMQPEPWRTQLKNGDWNIGTRDSDRQVIPSAWILAAQDRWRARAASWLPERERPYDDEELAEARPSDQVMTGYGLDVARGGKDWTVHVPAYVDFYAWPIKHPGNETPDGKVIVDQIDAMPIAHRHSVSKIVPLNIDADGPGSSPFDLAKMRGYNAVAIHGGFGSDAKDKSGLPFANLRAEMYWTLREELDPANSPTLCLPPHPEVLADLGAPRWKIVSGRIQVEPKDEIKKRIGRSPDVGDGIVYAHAHIRSADGYSVVDFYGAFVRSIKDAATTDE